MLIFKNHNLQVLINSRLRSKKLQPIFPESASNKKRKGKRHYRNTYVSTNSPQKSPSIWLVKDNGIYLTNASNCAFGQENNCHQVCYAEGYEANAHNIYEKCKKVAGGNCFLKAIRISTCLNECIQQGGDIHIEVHRKGLDIRLVFPKMIA